MPNVYEFENGRWKKENGSFLNKQPASGYWKTTSDDGDVYYQNLATGETMWELPRNRANSTNSASTIASLESSLASLRSECSAKDTKIAELEAKLKACGPGPSAASGVNISKFKKMLTLGIPLPAVKLKMQTEGVDPSLLNAANSGTAAPATTAPAAAAPAPFRPPAGAAGLMAALTGNLQGKLKKTGGPKASDSAVEGKPKTAAEEAASQLAKAIAEKRSGMKLSTAENIEAQQAARRAAAATAGDSFFKKELRKVVAAKKGEAAPPPPKRQVLNANNAGRLPKGWKYVIDEDGDKYYHKASNGTSQWERPSEGGRRRRNTRKNRRSSRKTRRN